MTAKESSYAERHSPPVAIPLHGQPAIFRTGRHVPTTTVESQRLPHRCQHHSVDRQNPMNASLHISRARAANLTIFSLSCQKSSEAAARLAIQPYTQRSPGRWIQRRNISRIRRRTQLRTTAPPIFRGVRKKTSPEISGSRGKTSKRSAASFRRLPDAKKRPMARRFRIVFVGERLADVPLSARMPGKFALDTLGNEPVSAFRPPAPKNDPTGTGTGSLKKPVLPYAAPF
ncbi:hypothetical protein MAMC_00726 [Methylacidimicrobium cyclopophantes]|uniref:Uncharacterized protein n=1 Tax=Methylacidimicrobium cyclopophantes TaxID=1041766 RepID=A0A5E6M8F3_9BACT|nr:hypothetical protein MAMC_00726 [Methylacidimicrobium cyclopophantes]